MKKFTLSLKKRFFCVVGLLFLLFSGFVPILDNRSFIHELLNKHYDKEEALKRYELQVTNSGFCRYKKVYTNGKEEFFSFNLRKFKSVEYLGDVRKGLLVMRTESDDVIVQTRNDRQGNIDSMATYLSIPLKNIEVDDLNALAQHLQLVK